MCLAVLPCVLVMKISTTSLQRDWGKINITFLSLSLSLKQERINTTLDREASREINEYMDRGSFKTNLRFNYFRSFGCL